MEERPVLQRVVAGDCAYWSDLALAERGVVVAFSERGGGASKAPYESLNLAAHVGDDADLVDENRLRLMEALGMGAFRSALTTAEQVHGVHVAVVDSSSAGAGAFAAGPRPPVEATDSLVSTAAHIPLMLCFADCVPVVIVGPGPSVAVVHAGWRGALASLPGKTVGILCSEVGCESADARAYIGAHIGACHYEVGSELLSQFVNTFGTFARADSGGLDLDAVVSASLERAGVARCNIARLGICTAEATDRFFSYRAEGGVTGRHAALACVL